jgi:predicted enzyme related to lactoylglutathione lyase
MSVPDPEASARFYGRLFDTQLFQEREPPPRFYVKVGIGYFAFGLGGSQPPRVDHVCVLISDYRAALMRAALESANVAMSAGPFGMVLDPDGLRLQLLSAPGGLAKTIVPAMRISDDEPLFQAIRPEHVVLRVSALAQSVAHYRTLFGREARDGRSSRIWFAAGPTRLGVEQAQPDERPGVDHILIKVAGFDRAKAAEKLRRINIETVPARGENLLRFRDLNGLAVELAGT